MAEYLPYVSLGLLAIIGLIVVFNAIKGLIRGLKKTVGTLIAIVLSAVIAGVVTLFVCKPSSGLMTMAMEALRGMVSAEELSQIFEIEALGIALDYYFAWLVAPLFFATAFVAVSFIVSIIVAIVIRFVPPFKKPGVLANRLGAVGVGILCGLIVSVIVLSPLGVLLGLVTDTGLGNILSNSGEDAAAIVEYCESDKTVGIIVAASTPVEAIFCSTDLEGEKVSLKTEISTVASIVENLGTLSAPMEEYDDTQIAALDAVVEEFGKAGVLRNALAGVIASASEAWLEGKPFIGMEKISAGELLDPTIDKMLEIMKTSTKDTVAADLGTVKDIFVVLIESELLTSASDSDNMLEKLGESGAIGDLLVAINSNPRMAPLADEIATLSIRALATSIGIPADAEQAYNDLMGNIADVLTDSFGMGEDERAAYVETEVVSALDRYGIDVSGEAASNISASILADLGNRNDVSASDVSEFFTVYAIASSDESVGLTGAEHSFDLLASTAPSMEIKENGNVVVNGTVLKCYDSASLRDSAAYQSGKSGVDFGGAATLYSAEGMESVLLTVADIIETLGSFAEIEDIEAEAAKIGAIIAKAADVFSGMDLENTEPSEILEKMGGILDDMKATEIFGADSTANLIKALLQNESVTESIGISGAQASKFADKLGEVASKSETGYADATAAVANTLNAVSVSKDSSKTAEEKKQASMDLINSMTSDNAELIGTLMSGDLMENQGADSESAEQVSDVMNLLLTNMAEYKGEDPDEASVSAEAEAVNQALSLAAMGAEGLKDQTLFDTADGESGVLGSTPDAFIDTVVNSKVIMTTVEQAVYDKEMGQNPLGIPSLSESEEQEVTRALENYFDENGGDADLERKLEAIAAMVNIDIDLG